MFEARPVVTFGQEEVGCDWKALQGIARFQLLGCDSNGIQGEC